MTIHDFVRLEDAQSTAMRLIQTGVQFAFCPKPLSISYPIGALITAQANQPVLVG